MKFGQPQRADRVRTAVVALVCLLPACDRLLPQRQDRTLPPISEIERIYTQSGLGAGSFALDGNVVEIRVTQPLAQLQRGGSLWARVGPFIYVFNPGTQILFDKYDGIAAVRAVTRVAGNREVARATLLRSELNEVLWRRALNLLGHAVNEGTRRPSLLLELVEWGQEHTTFRYNREFIPEAGSGP